MIPRLVPEISPIDAFCDVVVGVVGIGDSRSWMVNGDIWFMIPNSFLVILVVVFGKISLFRTADGGLRSRLTLEDTAQLLVTFFS